MVKKLFSILGVLVAGMLGTSSAFGQCKITLNTCERDDENTLELSTRLDELIRTDSELGFCEIIVNPTCENVTQDSDFDDGSQPLAGCGINFCGFGSG